MFHKVAQEIDSVLIKPSHIYLLPNLLLHTFPKKYIVIDATNEMFLNTDIQKGLLEMVHLYYLYHKYNIIFLM